MQPYILGFCGSLRRESLNKKLLLSFAQRLPKEIGFKEANYGNLPLFNEDIPIDQVGGLELLSQDIKAASAIVFATPEYNYSVPGGLKNALDWCSRHPLKPLDKKVAGVMGASAGAIGTARAQYHLRQIGVFFNLRFVNKPELLLGSMSASSWNADGGFTNPVLVNLMDAFIVELLALR